MLQICSSFPSNPATILHTFAHCRQQVPTWGLFLKILPSLIQQFISKLLIFNSNIRYSRRFLLPCRSYYCRRGCTVTECTTTPEFVLSPERRLHSFFPAVRVFLVFQTSAVPVNMPFLHYIRNHHNLKTLNYRLLVLYCSLGMSSFNFTQQFLFGSIHHLFFSPP